MSYLNNTKKQSPRISKKVWDTLELCVAHNFNTIDDSRLHDAGGRCSMCGKKTDVILDVIPEEDYFHWVCEDCMEILENARKK